MTVKKLNSFIHAGEDGVYTLIEVQQEEQFAQPMRIRKIDIYGKPSLNPEEYHVEWTIQPGRYFIKQVGIANGMPSWFQHGVDPARIDAPYTVEAGTADNTLSMTVRSWLQNLMRKMQTYTR